MDFSKQKYIYHESKSLSPPLIQYERDSDYIRIPKKWLISLEMLSPPERYVLLVLKSYKGKTGLVCPTQDTLSSATGYCKEQIKRIVRSLKRKKVILTKRKYRRLIYTISV